ncbi:hypothetical protein LTR72_010902 [Exophiala xenobiotica]|nr:hypothetical protein LTR72_010902 [Exophiala xenobiotica]KAK5244129.1 hypothetical protein LTS06_010251 [Exophiala xenobiotica]KAK5261003.1 hypothetical protein LTR40_003069 [Exophiala xenobiotica]KAK5285521.1 hypothetical protein LTR14_010917 [Exophiala xenobiotica]KAK5367124.1 hypothetical protein LTS13_007977 [Exophiala xenobiotica]
MDNVIFEDPSKARFRSKRHVRATPASPGASSIREYAHNVEPQTVTPVSEPRPQEHSHTTSVGHFGKPEPLRVTLVIPTSLFWCTAGFGALTSLCVQQNPDGLARNKRSLGTETREYDFVITSPGESFPRTGSPSLWTDIDTVDPTTWSNSPQLKLTAVPSAQRWYPPSSCHTPQVEVMDPSHRASARAERSASASANVAETPNGVGQRMASPRPGGHVVEHLNGFKRRYESESDFYSQDSHRQRVETGSDKTPSHSHRTQVEGSVPRIRRTENQIHKPDLGHGTLPLVGPFNFAHGTDSEQTIVDRGSTLNHEDETVPHPTLIEHSGNPTTALNIDESRNSPHEQGQHLGGLKGMSVQPVTPTDAAFITAIIDSPADLQNIFHSPRAWALELGFQPASLGNVSAKPLADRSWLLTATISRHSSGINDLERDHAGRSGRQSPDLDASGDYCPSEVETGLRRTKRGQWTAEEDDNLTRWRRLGKSWPWIFDQFPERSEAAVRSRWFVVLAPRR